MVKVLKPCPILFCLKTNGPLELNLTNMQRKAIIGEINNSSMNANNLCMRLKLFFIAFFTVNYNIKHNILLLYPYSIERELLPIGWRIAIVKYRFLYSFELYEFKEMCFCISSTFFSQLLSSAIFLICVLYFVASSGCLIRYFMCLSNSSCVLPNLTTGISYLRSDGIGTETTGTSIARYS